MKRQKKLNRKEIKLELESLLHMTGTATDSATIEDDLATLRVILEYIQLDQEALLRELRAAKKRS
ncbi:unnamed protein product [marine sediment metagenome]|uniref:Uncharacterized protein n=1 Tax=marine sediment metagenome TaxID=412755 RepID=X1FY13_9ZZZZ